MRLAAGLAALALLAAAAPASAQAPLGPLPAPAPQVDTSTVQSAPSTTTAGSGGLGTGSQVLIFVGAGALLALIAWVILRDARSHAPARGHTGAEPERKTTPPRAVRVSRGRARAKQARQARRRNR